MGIVNSNQSYSGLVQKYIGTAYDKMALLADNLDALILIADDIRDGSFQTIIDMAGKIDDAIRLVNEFNATYYGNWPRDGYYLPSLDVFLAEFSNRASSSSIDTLIQAVESSEVILAIP